MLVRSLASLLLVLACAGTDSPLLADEPGAGTFRVRLEWGGGETRTWTGLVEVDEGRFEELVPLGVDADLPGSMWAEGGAIWIQRNAPRVYDGLDAVVRAPSSSTLRISLQPRGDDPVRSSFEVPLAELATGDGRTVRIGDDGDRIVVRRAPGDVLALETDRSHLVFEPGETFEAGIAANLWTKRPFETQARFTWRLTPARSTRVLERGSRTVTVHTNAAQPAVLPARLDLPTTEGAFDLHVSLESRTIRETARIPLVVASGEPRGDRSSQADDEPVEATPDLVVDEFVPSEESRRRLGRRSRLGFLRPRWPFAGDEDRTASGPNWEAYSLDIDEIGAALEVEVTLDASPPRTVGVSLLQPNAAGRLVPLGIDSGIEIAEGDGASNEDGEIVVRHTIPFHPLVDHPVLLLHTSDPTTPIAARRVEVRRRKPIERTLPAVDRTSGRRLVGPYLHRPLLPEAFSAPEAFDEETMRSLDDWHTFDTAVRRFADHLRAAGNNAALMAVTADGSTIYPSRHLQPTLRYDTGLHFTRGRDPLRKDVVELLLRRFDRDGLVLVPMLRFSTPLPALERERARGRDRGLTLVHADGRSHRDVHPPDRGGAVDYNPLAPRTRAAVVEVVREFAERYAAHPSLSAVAIEIDADGCLVLPGDEWGFDEATIARFREDSGTTGDVRSGPPRTRWNEWRAARITEFHAIIAETITAAHPELRCVFVVESRDASLVDTAALARLPRTTVVERGGSTSEGSPLPGRRGFVAYDEPTGVRIADFDEVAPWDSAFTWLAPQVVPAGRRADRRGVENALLHDDAMVFDGGWMPTFGGSERTRDVRETIASLPDVRLRPLPDVSQPVVVRTGRDRDGRTWVVAANDFPYPTVVRFEVGGEDAEPHEVTLEPHGFEVFSLEAANARVAVGDVQVAAEARRSLARRLRELDGTIADLGRRTGTRRGELANPGFELAGAEDADLPGWSVRDASHWNVDERNARSGRAALLLAPESRSVAAVASPLELDRERHVLVSAWLKSDRDEADARLVFEATVNGRSTRRLAPVTVDRRWRRFEFKVEDVPPDARDARVRFEVRGPARVWIDDVDVRFAHVTPAELRQLETTSAAASLAMERGRYADALRLLDGPCRRFVEPATVTVRPPEPAQEDEERETPPAPRTWPWQWFR